MNFRATRILIPMFCALAAAGCDRWYEDVEEPSPLEEWIGLSDRNLVMKLGAPDRVYEMKDGRRIITWRHNRTEKNGGESYTVTETRLVDGRQAVVPVIRRTPVTTVRYECRMSFELDPNGYVVDYRAEGNDCTAPLPD